MPLLCRFSNHHQTVVLLYFSSVIKMFFDAGSLCLSRCTQSFLPNHIGPGVVVLWFICSTVLISPPDRPRPPPADFTTGRAPLSAPERWHRPRLPLWRPAHIHRWPFRVHQRGHPPSNQPGPAVLRNHTSPGRHGCSLWAGCHRWVEG